MIRVKGSSRATGQGYFGAVKAVIPANAHPPWVHAPGRRGPWGWRVRVLVTLGTAVLLAAGNAAAYARATGGAARQPARPGAAVATEPQLSQDVSGTVPVMHYGQTTGDFLGEGHDQVAYVKDNNLDIYEPNKFGGTLKESTPTDLRATPNEGVQAGSPVWQDGTPYRANSEKYGLTSVKVASSPSAIYMVGGNGRVGFGKDDYKLYLYEVLHNGSCATYACAGHVELPNHFPGPIFPCFGRDQTVAATSLAVGQVGGRTLIAVGLSDYGIFIYDETLHLVAHITDMGAGSTFCNPTPQTPVTSLGFGPPTGPGQGGVLAAGVESIGNTLFSYQLNPDGTEKSMTKAGSWQQVELASTAAYINGQLDTVFGRDDGWMFVMNPTTGEVYTPNTYAGPGAISGLTALTPWDGHPDNQELVVAKWDGTNDQVLKYEDGNLKAIQVGTGGATSVTDDQLQQWYPGYAAGRLQVVNASAGPVSVSMASRPDPGYGCWLNASVAQPPVPAFPTEASTVAAGQSSPAYFIGALTAGIDGSCASAQGKGEWSAYVVITPASDPGDEHLLKVRVTSSGDVEADSQVGGALTATLDRGSGPGGSWGQWNLTIKGPPAPTALAAPTLTGFRLTSPPGPDWVPPDRPAPDDPCRPVYRFDVTGASWKGAGVPGQVTAQIPAMTAQGSTDDGKTWRDLGELMPVSAPARSADTVTLGPASFFWQDPPGPGKGHRAAPKGQDQCPAASGKPLTDVRVLSGGLTSNVVHLADLKPPDIDGGPGATPIDSITATAATGENATPLADGVDQATVDLALNSNGGGVISNDDPRYKLVYYRDTETDNLVTGLYVPGHLFDYVAVGPFRGEYSDSGSAERVHNYLTTTSTGSQSLVADVNDSGTAKPYHSEPLVVAGSSLSQLGTTGTAAGGIQVTGCAGACPLAAPADTTPALYQAGSDSVGPVIGLQFKVEAVTGVASLPLEVGTENAHTLASAPLEIQPPGNKAVLRQTSGFWPAGTIDTSLITSGELVRALSVTVGGS